MSGANSTLILPLILGTLGAMTGASIMYLLETYPQTEKLQAWN